MIAPLPQLPLTPLAPETPGAKSDPLADGDGFAQILASATRVSPLPGPPPTPEHGPAIVAVTDLADPAISDAVAQPSSEADRRATASAEIFNQQGFFGTASSLEAVSVADARHIRVQSAPTVPEQTPAGPANIAGSPLSAGSGFDSSAPLSVHTALVVPPLRDAALTTCPAPALSGRPVGIEAEVPEPVKPATRRAPLRDMAARSAVRIVLHELEQGLHIVAQIQALDEPERIRLHDEIAALLARHGLAARSIRISAPGGFAHLQEKPR